MRKFMAIAAAIVAVAGVAGIVQVGDAKAACTILCNQYVRPYYKPSTGTWVHGYWRNSPSDSYRATPYTYPRYSYQPPRYTPSWSYNPWYPTYSYPTYR
jgi:hypothetical protein